jgi:hypothetical protein
LLIVAASKPCRLPSETVDARQRIDAICGHGRAPCLRRERYRTLSHRTPGRKAVIGDIPE